MGLHCLHVDAAIGVSCRDATDGDAKTGGVRNTPPVSGVCSPVSAKLAGFCIITVKRVVWDEFRCQR
jgi:hypothetical protein